MQSIKKDKIINDPIYGFIKINKGLIKNLIDHAYFQRLRRISQLGLSYLVYPGAHHTRFHHAIGCMFLMDNAIKQLKSKGQKITKKEAESLKIAILLHDIGHGPFSHALEKSIVPNISHEKISSLFMYRLNEIFQNKLSTAIKIFNNSYKKEFLHELVSSQLDMDRLDYLNRDSFYTGVVEGNIGTDRIISMLNVINNKLVVEEKGIYSVEKFLIARRLMYWQVYLHKTVISSENMLIKVLKRAKELSNKNINIFTTDSLSYFLKNNYSIKDFQKDKSLLEKFTQLDDYEIYTCLKKWMHSKDFILSKLSSMIINRRLLKIKIQKNRFNSVTVKKLLKRVTLKYKINLNEAKYFVFSEKVSNRTYNIEKSNINILKKNGDITDLTSVSDQFHINTLNKKVEKYFLCFPADI